MAEIRALNQADRPWVTAFLDERWGRELANRGRIRDVTTLPGFAAFEGGEPVGLVTYVVEPPACEIVTRDAVHRRQGIGTALVDATAVEARRAGCDRLVLITSNDNLDALRFYQRRGFRLAALHAGAVDEARRTLKPTIPAIGAYGIPLRDELELERPV